MTDSEKNAYQKKAEAQMEEWQAEIDRLKAKMKKQNADNQVEYERQIEELRKHRDTMQSRLEELQKQSGDAWNDVKAGLDQAWDNFSAAVKKAQSRF